MTKRELFLFAHCPRFHAACAVACLLLAGSWMRATAICRLPPDFTVGQLYYHIKSADGSAWVTMAPGERYTGDIVIPDSVTFNAVTYPVKGIESDAFNSCVEITSVSMGNTVQQIGASAFSNCRSMVAISLSKKLTSIGVSAFDHCTSLRSVTLTAPLKKISNETFYGCSALVSVAIPVGLRSIGDMAFHGCSNLASIALPSTVVEVGENAFQDCVSLSSVTLSSNMVTIAPYMFAGCTGLKTMSFPNQVRYIRESAFEGCRALASVKISYGVNDIASRAFADCVSLSTFTIPASTRTIANNAFAGSGIRHLQFIETTSTLNIYYSDDAVPLRPDSLLLGRPLAGNVYEPHLGVVSSRYLMANDSLTYMEINKLFDGPAHPGMFPNSISRIWCNKTEPAMLSLFYFRTYLDCEVIVPNGRLNAYKAAKGWKYFFNLHEEFTGIEGDLNKDGLVNVTDVTALINEILAGTIDNENLADLNGDGVVNVTDVTALITLILLNTSSQSPAHR